MRRKLKLQFIENAKTRMQRFKKRKEGLMKKLHEFTTLCGVGACMIIYEPTQNQTYIWPEHDPDQVRRLIDAATRNTFKSYGVLDYLDEMRRKAEEEKIKLRADQENSCLKIMSESQLRELGSTLRSKAEAVRSRIQLLKSKKKEEEEEEEEEEAINVNSNPDHQEIMPPATDLSHNAPPPPPPSQSQPQPFFVYTETEGLYYFFPMVQNLPASD